jgi:hypothetical protein
MHNLTAVLGWTTSQQFWRHSVPIVVALAFVATIAIRNHRANVAKKDKAADEKTASEKAAEETASQHARDGPTFLEAFLQVPIPAATMLGAVLAFLYNIGFFWSVGIVFMSIFTAQDHIVFALSGLVYLTAIFLIVNLLNFVIDMLQSVKNTNPIGLAFVFVGIWGLTETLWSSLFAVYEDAGMATAGALTLALAVGGALFLYLTFKQSNRRAVPIISIILLPLALFLGMYAGQHLVNSQREHAKNWALTESGERLGIVRIGSANSLLVDDKQVVKVFPTSSLKEIAADQSGKKPDQKK